MMTRESWIRIAVAALAAHSVGCQGTERPTETSSTRACKLAGDFLLGDPQVVEGECSLMLPEDRRLSMVVSEMPNQWQMRIAGRTLHGKALPDEECVFSSEPQSHSLEGYRAQLQATGERTSEGFEVILHIQAEGELAALCDVRLRMIGAPWSGDGEGNATGGSCGVGATCSKNLCAYGEVSACRYDVCLYERFATGAEDIYCTEPCIPGSCPFGFDCVNLGDWVFAHKEESFCVRHAGIADGACGDGILNAGEECDDGNLISGDGCSEFCQIEECGNGILDVGEECDDGNLNPGDGCSGTCRLENCGNGIVDVGEGCDDGNTIDTDRCGNDCRVRLVEGVARFSAKWAHNLSAFQSATVLRHLVGVVRQHAVVVWSERFAQDAGPWDAPFETFVASLTGESQRLTPPRRIPGASGWAAEDMVVTPGGEIVLLLRSGTSLAISRSHNAGRSFGQLAPLNLIGLPALREAGAFARMSVVGDVLLLLLGGQVESVEGLNRHLFVSRSLDFGASFTAPVQLSDPVVASGYVSLPQVLGAGENLAVVYGGGDPDAGSLYAARSIDQGATWPVRHEVVGGHAPGREEATWAAGLAHGLGISVVWQDPDEGLRHAAWDIASGLDAWDTQGLLPWWQRQVPYGPVALLQDYTDENVLYVAFAAGPAVWTSRMDLTAGVVSPPLRTGRLAAASLQHIADLALVRTTGRRALLSVARAEDGSTESWLPWGAESAVSGAFPAVATSYVFDGSHGGDAVGGWQSVEVANRSLAVMHRGDALLLSDIFSVSYESDPQQPLGQPGQGCAQALSDGGWCKPRSVGAPSPRYGATSAVAGDDMVVFGGTDGFRAQNSGGAYRWASDTWRSLPALNAGPSFAAGRSGHSMVWTGDVLIVFGGHNGLGPLGDGFSYDPSTDVWEPISTVGAPTPRYGHTATWAASRMVVWGGFGPSSPLADGAVYDPASDTWTSLGTDIPRAAHGAVTDGEIVYLFGGVTAPHTYLNEGLMIASDDALTPLAAAQAPSARAGAAVAWANGHVLVWGGYNAAEALATGGIYTPGVGWSSMSAAGAPAARRDFVSAFTGSAWLIWGGLADGSGAVYDPNANEWASMTSLGAPEGRFAATAVWTGDRMVVWGGRSSQGQPTRAGGIYVPPAEP